MDAAKGVAAAFGVGRGDKRGRGNYLGGEVVINCGFVGSTESRPTSLVGTPPFRIAILPLILVKLAIMNRPAIYSLSILFAALFWLPNLALARPLDFNEVSLLVRVREPESSIKEEASRRKLMRPLTTHEESRLKAQGASDSLIRSLRNSDYVASKEEAAASESQRPIAAAARDQMVDRGPRVHVFNLAYGHPVNLSEWGGADYEIAVYSYRIAGEDHVQAAMIDNIRTGTDVARTIPLLSEGETFARDFYPTSEVRNWRFTPYDARGDLRDNRFNFSDSVATSSHSFERPLRIDWDSPVFIEGQPYTFYRVYGAGGVSLYYIGKATERAAMMAVVSQW
jgi:hypothetical protein